MTPLAAIKRIAVERAFRTRVRLSRLPGRSVPNPHDLFGGVSDRFWRWLILRGARGLHGLETSVPAVPGNEMQRNWTGSSGESTLQEAFDFYRLVLDRTRAHGRPIGGDTRVLDFGCGWGRIIRFFLRDVDHWHLHGCDCYPEALVQARRNSRWGHFVLTDPQPPAPFRDGSFDLIYLYSVFSHLAEAIHLDWLREFHRLLRPGGFLVATTRKRTFILECAALRARSTLPAFAAGGAASFRDTAEALRRYDAGEFCHSPTGGGGVLAESFYGETCIPQAYVERQWGQLFKVQDFLDADTRCPQAVAVVQKM